jgi:hypothetical protein
LAGGYADPNDNAHADGDANDVSYVDTFDYAYGNAHANRDTDEYTHGDTN